MLCAPTLPCLAMHLGACWGQVPRRARPPAPRPLLAQGRGGPAGAYLTPMVNMASGGLPCTQPMSMRRPAGDEAAWVPRGPQGPHREPRREPSDLESLACVFTD